MPYFVPPPMSEEVEQKETILPGGVIQEVISPKYFIVLSTTLM